MISISPASLNSTIMMKPKISIIVPIYNVEKYIERCCRSLFEQTLSDLEYIFVDDCSPDNSISIVKSVVEEYPNRKNQVHIIKHHSNKGLTCARNSGIAIATGTYIAHCDSDDYVDTLMYEKLYNAAIDQGGADIITCDFNFVYPDRIQRHDIFMVDDSHDKTLINYIRSGWTTLWCMIVKKEIYDEHHLRSPEDIIYTEDFWLGVRLMYFANKMTNVHEPLYYYNQENTTSIMKSRDGKSVNEERECYLQTIRFFEEQGVIDKFQEALSWRILKNKQDLVLDPSSHALFLSIYPVSHKYIWSCPTSFCNKKIKLMMWFLTHHLGFVTVTINNLRSLLRR